MKYLKIFAIFILVVGGLVLALRWNSHKEVGPVKDHYPDKDLIDVEAWRQRLENNWNDTAWDVALYIKQYKNIEQKKGNKLITKKTYDLAHEALFERAANTLRFSFGKSLKQPYYADATVQKLRHDVDTITTYEKIGDVNAQSRLAHIVELYTLYTNIKTFVGKTHAIKLKYNKETCQWSSFNSLQNSILKTASDYRNNPLYSEMNTIQIFVEGLNESKLKTTTETYRKGFCEDLSKEIISSFTYTVEPKDIDSTNMNQATIVVNGKTVVVYRDKLNNEKQKKLGECWNKFYEDVKVINGYSSVVNGYTTLSKFKTGYSDALKALEKNN